jgi:hypothetical protein
MLVLDAAFNNIGDSIPCHEVSNLHPINDVDLAGADARGFFCAFAQEGTCVTSGKNKFAAQELRICAANLDLRICAAPIRIQNCSMFLPTFVTVPFNKTWRRPVDTEHHNRHTVE